MSETEDTVSRVRVDYVAEDHASGVAKKIAEAYREPAEAVNRLKERFRELRGESILMATGALGVGLGLGSLIDKAKEANREFGGAQKSIASTLSTVLQWDKGIDAIDRYHRSARLASGVTEELDEKAADLGLQLGDMAAAYRTLAVAAAPMHLSQRQLIDLTEKASATAVRFGESTTAVADQVGHAMVTRVVRPFGDVGIYLRENIGKNLQHLNNAQVLAQFDKAMSGSVDTAKEMASGLGGSIIRIQNRVDDMFRHVSGPVFKEVTRDVERFYEKLKSATAEGRPLMDVYGDKLLSVFREMKEAAGFIANHWQTIAAIWATSKVPKLFEGAAAGAGFLANRKNPLGGIADIGKLFSQHGAGGAAGGGVGNILGVLGSATQGIAGLATASVLAAQALHGVYEEWQSRKHQAADLGGFFKDMGEVARTQRYVQRHGLELSPDQMQAAQDSIRAHTAAAAESLKQKGLLENGALAMEKFNGVMDSMAEDVRKNFMSMVPGAPDASSGLLGAYTAELFRKNYVSSAASVETPDDTGRKTGGKTFNFFGPININQKFEDNEPDRVAVRLKDDLENYAGRRTQSMYTGAGGF